MTSEAPSWVSSVAQACLLSTSWKKRKELESDSSGQSVILVYQRPDFLGSITGSEKVFQLVKTIQVRLVLKQSFD